MPECLFYSLKNATLLKQSLWHRPFPMNIANTFLRTPFYRTHQVVTPAKFYNFYWYKTSPPLYFSEVSKTFRNVFWCAARIFLKFIKILVKKYLLNNSLQMAVSQKLILLTAMITTTLCFLILGRLPLLGSPWNEILLEALEWSICVAARPFYVDQTFDLQENWRWTCVLPR